MLAVRSIHTIHTHVGDVLCAAREQTQEGRATLPQQGDSVQRQSPAHRLLAARCKAERMPRCRGAQIGEGGVARERSAGVGAGVGRRDRACCRVERPAVLPTGSDLDGGVGRIQLPPDTDDHLAHLAEGNTRCIQGSIDDQITAVQVQWCAPVDRFARID